MCGGFVGGIHGRAMTDYAMSLLSPEEKSFWDRFIALSKEEMGFTDDRGAEDWIYNNKPKLQPSVQLQSLYNEAVTEYNGEQWCHFNQLCCVFNFASIPIVGIDQEPEIKVRNSNMKLADYHTL